MPTCLFNAVIQIGVTKCWIDVGCLFEYFWQVIWMLVHSDAIMEDLVLHNEMSLPVC